MTAIEDAYRKYATERFALPNRAQVGELERSINVTLPEDYREFLLKFNGGYFDDPDITPVGEGCPLEGLTCLFGIGASDSDAQLEDQALSAGFEENAPPIIVEIGYTGLGALILLSVDPESPGCIFLKQAFGDVYYLADGIEEFFALLGDPPTIENDS